MRIASQTLARSRLWSRAESFAVRISIHLEEPGHLNQTVKMLQYLAIYTILVTGILYLLHYSVRCVRKGKLIDKIPGPYAWPFFGNTFEFLLPLEKLWGAARRLNGQYYGINRIWSMALPMVNIYHPDDVEALLSSTKHIEKSLVYDFLQSWLGTGLLTSKGTKWHKRRKILTPAFHFKILQQFFGIFMEQSEKLANSLCLEGDEVIDDLVLLLHKYTLHSICETTMGFKDDVDSKVLNEYRSCVSEIGDITIYRLIRPWLYMDWMFQFFKKCREQVRVLKVLHGFSTNIINDRKRYHQETDGAYLKGLGFHCSNTDRFMTDEGQEKGKRRLAMLDLLISAANRGASIDDEGIREEVDTFIFEGHDTTAMALCFSLVLLAENKEIQDKARAEVDAVFGEEERSELSFQKIQSLGYLERCIKESLRLFPSVPFISRRISEDIQLKNYLVPGGTTLNVFIYDLHRDPNFWPDPNVFNPDRFLPDQVQGRHPFAYVPFSAGSRNCIGRKFATLELKALIGTFLRNFFLEAIDLSSDIQICTDLVLRPMNPVRMKLVRRSHDGQHSKS